MRQLAGRKEGLDGTSYVEQSTSMATEVFISSCVKIYCVLSAAHFNSGKTNVFLNLTQQLWHMVKGWLAVSVVW